MSLYPVLTHRAWATLVDVCLCVETKALLFAYPPLGTYTCAWQLSQNPPAQKSTQNLNQSPTPGAEPHTPIHFSSRFTSCISF